MKIYLLFASTLIITFSMAQNAINIIPQPIKLDARQGYFIINNQTGFKYNDNKDLRDVASFFGNSIYEISGYKISHNKPTENIIELRLDKNSVQQAEGYKLYVTPGKILIIANTKQGVLYAIQSILQTLPAIRTNAALQVPCMDITDYPAFSWRGMHLDVCRHFFSPETIKEYIDLLAKYKLNVFHWHLTDDQGWRIEIKKYPLLTKIGAWRVDRTDKDWSNRTVASSGENATYGGFYTQEQIKSIVQYASERGITIVPEIEMPGHADAAIASYPFLSCIQKTQSVLTGGQYPKDFQVSFCAGNDSVFTFMQNVLSEVIQLFPSQYIHIGGDEVDKSFWATCPKCQKRMKDEHLKNTEELQSYFVKRIEKYLISKNRRMIGWDEILEGGLAPEATVMSWRGESGGIAAAKMKHQVVMTPGSPLYFDHYQAGPQGEPVAFGGFNTLKKVYDYNPIPKELNAEEGKYVLGAQANLWTEYIQSREHLEYMVLPRMAALAEVVWTKPEFKNFNDFRKRLKAHFTAYEQLGLHYSRGNYAVDIIPISGQSQLKVKLATEMPDVSIHYTTDGTVPDIESPSYELPFEIKKSTKIQAVAVENRKIMNMEPASQTFVMHKGVGASVSYKNGVSNYYMADGPNSLADGIRGTHAINKYWHGFSGKDLIATVDLGKETEIEKVTLGCLQHYKDWIFFPVSVKFEVSEDGKDYSNAVTVVNTIPVNEASPMIKDFLVSYPKVKARYIRVIATILSAAPAGHPGEGKPVWIFADEIIVE